LYRTVKKNGEKDFVYKMGVYITQETNSDHFFGIFYPFAAAGGAAKKASRQHEKMG